MGQSMECFYLCGPNTIVYDTSFTWYACRVVLINSGCHFITDSPSCQYYDAVYVKNNGTLTINANANGGGFKILYEPTATVNDLTGNAITYTCSSLIFPPVNCTVTGINNSPGMSSTIDIFPNPSKGELFTQLKDGVIDSPMIEIYNSQGKLVYKEMQSDRLKSVDLSKLSNGIYLVKVLDKASILVSKKIILNQ
jgi:hypothetical protein